MCARISTELKQFIVWMLLGEFALLDSSQIKSSREASTHLSPLASKKWRIDVQSVVLPLPWIADSLRLQCLGESIRSDQV